MPISWGSMGSGWDEPAPRRSTAPSEPTGRVQLLEEKLDKLGLICQAMWEILRDNGGVPEEALAAKVEEIDLRDGVLDGRLNRGNTPCPRCGKMINRKHRNCLYCGTEKPQDSAFDAL